MIEHARMSLRGDIVGRILRDARQAFHQEPFRINAEKPCRLDAAVPHPFKGAIDTPYLSVPVLEHIDVVSDGRARRNNSNTARPALPRNDTRQVAPERAVDVRLTNGRV